MGLFCGVDGKISRENPTGPHTKIIYHGVIVLLLIIIVIIIIIISLLMLKQSIALSVNYFQMIAEKKDASNS